MQLLDSGYRGADLVAVVVVVVAAVAEDIVAVVFVAAFEAVEVVASVVVLTVVSVVAVFVAVVLTLLKLKTKILQPNKQNHRISNMFSSSVVYHILTYLLHRDNRRSRLVISN